MNVEEDSMFDITAINQPFGTFATAKNANITGSPHKGTLVGKNPADDNRALKIIYKDNGFTMEKTLPNDHYEKWRQEKINSTTDEFQWVMVTNW